MMVLVSFFVDVALKLSGFFAGRSRAGLSGDTGYCEGTLKSNALSFYEKCTKIATYFTPRRV
jgi:hypothetical protein